jgi:hypothetical protein
VKNKKLFFVLIGLTIVTISCSIFIGGPAYTITVEPVATESTQDLQSYIQQAVLDSAQTGIVNLKISESQLTRYLASKLESQTDPIITEPQVILRDGQMKVYGKAQSGVFTANISVTTRIIVDDQGQPQIEITQTDFGPLPAPNGLNDAMSRFMQEAFTGSLGPIATGFRLENITIADGLMIVTGRIK